ncbi:10475_t:CDS:2, partial [Ambispora leptoticha]
MYYAQFENGLKHIHTRTMKPYFVEFVDVGESTKHLSSRNMFYPHVDVITMRATGNPIVIYSGAEVLNSHAF